MSKLDQLEIFSSLSEAEKSNLEMFCQDKKLSSWEKLFNEKDEANSMYFVKKGSLEVSTITNGEKKMIWVVWQGWIIWEMALFWETNKRMATATALDNVELITILWFSIKSLAEKNPELLEKIKKIIEKRW